MNILGLAIAGAIGTVCRYEIGKIITYQQFPVATLLINTLGSLLLGFLFVKYATNHQQLFVLVKGRDLKWCLLHIICRY